MTRILKYQVDASGVVKEMPMYAKVITAGFQGGRLTVWAIVTRDDENETSTRNFQMVGTGSELLDGFEHIATVFDGSYVWHIGEVPAT